MSFLSRFFARKLTYTPYFGADKNYPELIHVFGADRRMPEDGESYDIWHHRLIDTKDYSVVHGIKQTGNDFNIRSPFAQRALEEMSKKLNRDLVFNLKPAEPPVNFHFRDSLDSDTDVLPELPENGILITTYKTSALQRFSIQLSVDGKRKKAHLLDGHCDYYRKSVLLKEKNQLITTYRKESRGGLVGGMAFYVLDLASGELVKDEYII